MGEQQNGIVLAMYDIRGKQSYIYRENSIKEIAGGSAIIRDCFKDYLFPVAIAYRNSIYDAGNNEAIFNYTEVENGDTFSWQAFHERMENPQYLGEVIYDGGGNFIMLYRDEKTCVEVNKIFTKRLLEKTYSLNVLCTYITIDCNADNYIADKKRLYEQHRINEAQESVIHPCNSLPFVQVDYATSLPLSQKVRVVDIDKKVSLESFAKYEKYDSSKNKQGEKILDNLVTQKGTESLLAVIFIDGNNMGAQVDNCLGSETSYEKCINSLREFSNGIQRDYIDNRVAAIDRYLEEKEQEKNDSKLVNIKQRRLVVSAGDEMTIICNARYAMGVVNAYFKDLPQNCSSCAGIAIFHSHAPYADAYRIAEECCESGKALMKKNKETTACYLDFHYCQSGIGMSLQDIRKAEGELDSSKPWLIKNNGNGAMGADNNHPKFEDVAEIVANLNVLGRTNVKGLLEPAKRSKSDYEMEKGRIIAHQKADVKNKLTTVFTAESDERTRKLMYDIISVYDLWFYDNKGDKKI